MIPFNLTMKASSPLRSTGVGDIELWTLLLTVSDPLFSCNDDNLQNEWNGSCCWMQSRCDRQPSSYWINCYSSIQWILSIRNIEASFLLETTNRPYLGQNVKGKATSGGQFNNSTDTLRFPTQTGRSRKTKQNFSRASRKSLG